MSSEAAVVQRLSVEVGERDHVRGPIDAPLTLLEYGDYECPYCGRAFPIVNQLRAHDLLPNS